MSWDLWVIRYDGPRDLDEFRDDRVEVLGVLDDVRRSMAAWSTALRWSDPRHGSLDGEGWSIDFSLNESDCADAVGSITLRVYGGGDPISTIVRLCKSAGWQAIDMSSGKFLDLDNPTDNGWTHFQAFRDRIVEGQQNDG
jgi:hypothetical protein